MFLHPQEKIRLPNYFKMLQGSGVVSLVVVGWLIYSFPSFFFFFKNVNAVLTAVVILFVWHLIFFAMELYTGKHGYFTYVRYGWVMLFCFLVYISGGIYSPIMYILVVPLLVSTVDLNPNDTARVGGILVVYFVVQLYFDKHLDVSTIGLHLFTIFIYCIISYYLYKLVKESLREKYEKEQIKAENKRLLELDRVKSDFISIASHRLRSPLSGIMWALTEVVSPENNELTPAQHKEIESSALREVNKAIVTVNELIKSVEIDDEHYRLQKEDIDLKDLIQNIVKSLQALIQINKVTLTIHQSEEVHIQGDRALLTLSIKNIIDNAVRYSFGKTVEVVWQVVNNKIKLSVEDKGMGISKVDIGYVFERFYRGKEAFTTEPNASGVGLYTAKRIVELHGGIIQLHSVKNEGTRVIVELPIS